MPVIAMITGIEAQGGKTMAAISVAEALAMMIAK
jgi:hypothetical protein